MKEILSLMSKYLNKFKKAISSSLIQSYPENLSVLKKIIAKKEKINEKFISIHLVQMEH